MSEHEQHLLHVWQDPESKIRFLETILHGKNWRSDIHVPALDVPRVRQMAALSQSLQKRGYHVERIAHEDGHQILRIEHEHNPQNLERLLRDYGYVTGAAHVLQSPLVAVKDLIGDISRRLEQGVNYLKDPARANGLIFLTSEAFITASSLGAKDGKWHDPKNLLLSVAGSLFLSQSATYLFLAKKGNERIVDDFTDKLNKAQQHMGDSLLPELAKAPPINAKKASGLVDKVSDFFNAYPIQIGAMANNLGMLAFLGAFWLERKFQAEKLAGISENAISAAKSLYEAGFAGSAGSKAVKAAEAVASAAGTGAADAKKFLDAAKIQHADNYLRKGYYMDSGGAITSLMAWTFMLLPPKETKHKSDNPLVRFWQTVREDPQKVTSAVAFGSSSLRLLGSRERENMLQAIGEAIYIPGDIMLWFTKNNEYGHSTGGNHDSLIEAAAKTINHLPIVMSAERRQAFVHEACRYLAKQSHALANKGEELPEAELAVKAAEMETALESKLSNRPVAAFDHIIGLANQIVSRFPDANRAAVADTLSHTLSALKGIEASAETIRQRISASVTSPGANITAKAASIQDLAQPLSDLVFSIPGPFAATNASLLYDALAPMLTPQLIAQQHSDKQHLDKVMTQTALADILPELPQRDELVPSDTPDTMVAAQALSREPLQVTNAHQLT